MTSIERILRWGVAPRACAGFPRLARAEALERRQLLSGNFSISDASVVEGNSGFANLVFTVEWTGSFVFDAGSVTASTSDGTASAAEGDYTPNQQQLDFPLFGVRSQQFLVRVAGDTRAESSETVVVSLSSPANGSIGDGIGIGTIVDDDPPTATFVPVSPDPREGPVSEVSVRFSEPVTGVDISDFTLWVNQQEFLLTPAQSVTSVDGGVTWTVRGLEGMTGAAGEYVLFLAGRPTGIRDAAGNELPIPFISEVWHALPPPAPTNLSAYNLGDVDRLVFTDNSVGEIDFVAERRFLTQGPEGWTQVQPLIPGNAAGQTGTVTFDVPAVAPPPGEQWVYHVYAERPGSISGYSNPTLVTPAGLRETIYDTTEFADNPNNPNDPIVRIDPDINHDFDAQGGGSPAPGKVDADTFSVVWEGYFTPAQSGTYTLFGGSDDGMRVYLDGNLVVDAFLDRPYAETPSAPLALTAGSKHELRVDYYENLGLAAARLKYEGPGVAGRQVIPFTQLSRPTGAEALRAPTNLATTRIADCVTVWFHDISASETGYEIQRSITLTGGYATIGTAPANADHFADPGPLLTNGTPYYYRVRALGPGNTTSAYSAPTGPVFPTDPAGAVDYPTFADNNADDNLTFNGTAMLVDRDQDRAGTFERLMLTEALPGQIGSAYLTDPRSVHDFRAAFDFQVTSSQGADGFTFILQGSRSGTAALGGGGGALGFAGIPNSVAVKYDFWPFINQTGVYTNGQDMTDDGADPRNRDVPLTFDLDNGQVYHTTLAYDSAAKVLTQTIDDFGNPATAPFTATYNVDIPAAIGGECAYVGFTGATGDVFARQEILGMSFRNGEPAPRVQQVYVSGSAWTPAFKTYLRDQGLGSIDFGFAIGAGAAQTDELPWNNINRISITFDRQVNADPADLEVRGVNFATYPVTTYAYDAANRTGTWTLGRSIVNDKVLLDLDGDAGGVSGGGARLDGEWTTSGNFPSGNGTAGGDFKFRLNALPGDVNRSGSVLADDFSAVKSRFFRSTTAPGTGGTAYTIFHDVDGSGSILADDFSAVKARFFTSLPGPDPTAAAAAMPSRTSQARPLRSDLFYG